MASYGKHQIRDVVTLMFEQWVMREHVAFDKEVNVFRMPFQRKDGIYCLNFHMVQSHTSEINDENKDKDFFKFIDYLEPNRSVLISCNAGFDTLRVESLVMSIDRKHATTFAANQIGELNESITGKSFDPEGVLYNKELGTLGFPIQIGKRIYPLVFTTVSGVHVEGLDDSSRIEIEGVGFEASESLIYLKNRKNEAYFKCATFFAFIETPPREGS